MAPGVSVGFATLVSDSSYIRDDYVDFQFRKSEEGSSNNGPKGRKHP